MERGLSIVSYYILIGGFIFLGSILGLEWVFPFGVGLAILGAVAFIYGWRQDSKGK